MYVPSPDGSATGIRAQLSTCTRISFQRLIRKPQKRSDESLRMPTARHPIRSRVWPLREGPFGMSRRSLSFDRLPAQSDFLREEIRGAVTTRCSAGVGGALGRHQKQDDQRDDGKEESEDEPANCVPALALNAAVDPDLSTLPGGEWHRVCAMNSRHRFHRLSVQSSNPAKSSCRAR
jgi:hypothetical protein